MGGGESWLKSQLTNSITKCTKTYHNSVTSLWQFKYIVTGTHSTVIQGIIHTLLHLKLTNGISGERHQTISAHNTWNNNMSTVIDQYNTRHFSYVSLNKWGSIALKPHLDLGGMLGLPLTCKNCIYSEVGFEPNNICFNKRGMIRE